MTATRPRSCAPVLLALALALPCGCVPTAVIGYDKAEPRPDAGDELPLDAGALDAADAGDAVVVETGVLDAGGDAEPLRDAAPEDAAARDAAVIIRGPLSGLAWPSGVHYGNETASYAKFAEYRGRPLDLATLYVDRNSWTGLVMPGWPLGVFESFPGRLVLNEPPYPMVGSFTNQACAAGDYDAEWKKLGSFLIERGRPDVVIRLAWGGNDPKHVWRTDADPTDYIGCYRHIVRAVHSTNPRVQFDFTFDPIQSALPASGNPYDLYPGDDVVDIVGMDVFDRGSGVRTEAEWKAKCEGPLGLCTLIAFARAHKKRFAVGEWGAVTCGDAPGGDNAFFIEKMVQTFRDNADILAYEAYFDDSAENVCSTLMDPAHLPEARAAYRRLYQQ